MSKLNHADVLGAMTAFREGRNVTEFLRGSLGVPENTPGIIELAYDMQAGSYIDGVQKDGQRLQLYAAELAAILTEHLPAGATLLDIGTGEMTTLSLLVKQLPRPPAHVYAFDISWSRLFKGLSFARRNMPHCEELLTAFVGDIGEIPLRDKSVDVVTSSHALEPNGGSLEPLLRELFRVAKSKLVLFEPCYELASDEGKRRMERLGYIRDVQAVVERLGGKVLERRAITNIANPLNPTACFVIEPPQDDRRPNPTPWSVFSVPGTDYPLAVRDGFLFSNDVGLCYPKLLSIPVLRSSAAVLATALVES